MVFKIPEKEGIMPRGLAYLFSNAIRFGFYLLVNHKNVNVYHFFKKDGGVDFLLFWPIFFLSEKDSQNEKNFLIFAVFLKNIFKRDYFSLFEMFFLIILRKCCKIKLQKKIVANRFLKSLKNVMFLHVLRKIFSFWKTTWQNITDIWGRQLVSCRSNIVVIATL